MHPMESCLQLRACCMVVVPIDVYVVPIALNSYSNVSTAWITRKQSSPPRISMSIPEVKGGGGGFV